MLDWEHYDQVVASRTQQLTKELRTSIDAWQGWTEMPPDAELLSFYRENGRISYHKAWRSPRNIKAATERGTRAVYVPEISAILGRYHVEHPRLWNAAVANWYAAERKVGMDGIWRPLDVFAEKYLLPLVG